MVTSLPESTTVRLVVPCYNEAARFDASAFRAALQEMPWLQVLLVNDGSTDNTLTLLEALARSAPDRVRVLSLPRNSGKAEAVRQGLLSVSDGPCLCGFWDADLAAPLAELPALRSILISHPQFEWVWGARVRTLGRRIARRATRHYLGRIFATVASISLGVPSYDTQCGAKLFRCSPLLRAVIDRPFRSRWIFDVELLSRADSVLAASRMPGVQELVLEQPLAMWLHRPGSKVRPMDFARALRDLWRIRSDRASWRQPIADWGQQSAEAGAHAP